MFVWANYVHENSDTFCARVVIDIEIGIDGNYLSQLLLLIFLYFYFHLRDFYL